MATYLSKVINVQKTDVQEYQSMTLFNCCIDYLTKNNFKYEMDTRKLKFELNNSYNIQDKKVVVHTTLLINLH